jgi:hypothetical protein
VAELVTAYALSDIEIPRDRKAVGGLRGFTHQSLEPADQALSPESGPPPPDQRRAKRTRDRH